MAKKANALITVNNVSVGYRTTTLLEGLSFEVYEGEVFVILGGSGCGKSTLLKNMIGLYLPLKGVIVIDGVEITKSSQILGPDFFKRIGVMYQNGALFSSLTLLENVMLPLEELTDLPHSAQEIIAATKLKLVNLQGFEHYLPSEISGGMKKRAAIARAMALDPKIIFLDEPSAGLDPITAVELDVLIQRLAQTLAVTFVVVSHDVASVLKIADRVIFLDGVSKSIIAQGDPHTLKKSSPEELVRRFFNRERNTVS